MSKTDTEQDLVLLTEPADQIESGILQDLLRQEGIPVLVKDVGSGGYLKVYMGYSVFGDALYVQRGQYERACELLQMLRQDGSAALADAQPDAFDDAELFEAYEAAQESEKPQENTKKEKSIIPALLILVAAILLSLWQLGH